MNLYRKIEIFDFWFWGVPELWDFFFFLKDYAIRGMRIHPSRCSIQRNSIRSDNWMTRSPRRRRAWRLTQLDLASIHMCNRYAHLIADLPARRTHGHTITSWHGYTIVVRLLGQFRMLGLDWCAKDLLLIHCGAFGILRSFSRSSSA